MRYKHVLDRFGYIIRVYLYMATITKDQLDEGNNAVRFQSFPSLSGGHGCLNGKALTWELNWSLEQ
jgi:hypothetical protein